MSILLLLASHAKKGKEESVFGAGGSVLKAQVVHSCICFKIIIFEELKNI